MTEKGQKYRKLFRSRGKHLHKNEYLPINLAKHPMRFFNGSESVVVDWGWAARTVNGAAYIDFDDAGMPMPYEGFWEARCCGQPI